MVELILRWLDIVSLLKRYDGHNFKKCAMIGPYLSHLRKYYFVAWNKCGFEIILQNEQW